MKLNEMNDAMNRTEIGSDVFTPDPSWTPLEAWGYGLLFVTIISLSSIMGIVFLPLMKKSFYATVMRFMIGLAIGSLSGSAIFHLIPQAFGLSHETQKNYIFVASFIWLSIWIVMSLESTIKILVKGRAIRRQKKQTLKLESEKDENDSDAEVRTSTGSKTDELNTEISELQSETEEIPKPPTSMGKLFLNRSTLSLHREIMEEMKRETDLDSGDKSIKTVAWIVIIGDSLHNFIDGVSIGAGFSQSFSTGLILSLAVIFEEFPHELGDFAILINSGLSVKKAIMFNFLSALTCYLGLALGIILGKIEFENLIFAFAAGIFLYVSLADMVPEVTGGIEEACNIDPKQGWIVLVTHHAGIFVGIMILYVLATNSPP